MQTHTTPLPALSGAPRLLLASPGPRACGTGDPRSLGPCPPGEMPLGRAGAAPCRARLPETRRAPGDRGGGSGSGGAQGSGFFPMCSQPGTSPRRAPSTGHDKEPVSQKCLLSATAGQPVTGMISGSIRAHTALSQGCGGAGPQPPAQPARKRLQEGWRQHDGGHRRLDHGRWSCEAGKSQEGQGRAMGSCLCPRIGTCRNSNQRTEVVAGGRHGKLFSVPG